MVKLTSIGITRHQQSANIIIGEDLMGDLLDSALRKLRESLGREGGDERSERVTGAKLLRQLVEHLERVRGAPSPREVEEVGLECVGPERGRELLEEGADGGEVAAAGEMADDEGERAVGRVERAADEEAEEVGGGARGGGRGEGERLGEEGGGGADVGEVEGEVCLRGGGGGRGGRELGDGRGEGGSD